jgi:hypothetical protein
VERAVAKLRPEGAASGADHTGFGTLLYARDAADTDGAAMRVAPAAVYANAREGAAELSWLRTREPETYEVERADAGRALRVVARGNRRGLDPAVFRDIAVTTERQYRYRVAARGARPGELVSDAVAIMAGLPREWTPVALGKSSIAPGAQFDGQMLTLRAAGNGLMAPEDQGCLSRSRRTALRSQRALCRRRRRSLSNSAWRGAAETRPARQQLLF